VSKRERYEYEAIRQELDRLARLLALSLSRGLPFREQVKNLHLAGFSPSEIAKLLGTTSVSVRVTLYHIRQAERSKRARQARRARK